MANPPAPRSLSRLGTPATVSTDRGSAEGRWRPRVPKTSGRSATASAMETAATTYGAMAHRMPPAPSMACAAKPRMSAPIAKANLSPLGRASFNAVAWGRLRGGRRDNHTCGAHALELASRAYGRRIGASYRLPGNTIYYATGSRLTASIASCASSATATQRHSGA